MMLERQLMPAMPKREAKLLAALLRKLQIAVEGETNAWKQSMAVNSDLRASGR